MDDFSAIINYVSRHIVLTEEDKAFYASLLKIKQVKKKQYIVQPDFICGHRTYILKGSMRAYVIDANGQEDMWAFHRLNNRSCKQGNCQGPLDLSKVKSNYLVDKEQGELSQGLG